VAQALLHNTQPLHGCVKVVTALSGGHFENFMVGVNLAETYEWLANPSVENS